MPKRRKKVRNARKFVSRVEHILASRTVSPERLAKFERHMSAREKLGRNSDLAWSLKSAAQMHAITNLSSSELDRFEKAQRSKGMRQSLKQKLGF